MKQFPDLINNPDLITQLQSKQIKHIHYVVLDEKVRQSEYNGSRFKFIIKMEDCTQYNFSVVLWDHMASYFISHLYIICMASINMDQYLKELRTDLLELI